MSCESRTSRHVMSRGLPVTLTASDGRRVALESQSFSGVIEQGKLGSAPAKNLNSASTVQCVHTRMNIVPVAKSKIRTNPRRRKDTESTASRPHIHNASECGRTLPNKVLASAHRISHVTTARAQTASPVKYAAREGQ